MLVFHHNVDSSSIHSGIEVLGHPFVGAMHLTYYEFENSVVVTECISGFAGGDVVIQCIACVLNRDAVNIEMRLTLEQFYTNLTHTHKFCTLSFYCFYVEQLFCLFCADLFPCIFLYSWIVCNAGQAG